MPIQVLFWRETKQTPHCEVPLFDEHPEATGKEPMLGAPILPFETKGVDCHSTRLHSLRWKGPILGAPVFQEERFPIHSKRVPKKCVLFNPLHG